MEQVLEAIYSKGVFTPLEPPNLRDNQQVRIIVYVPEEPAESLLAWQEVYSGLSDQDITDVEQIALDRR